jgi:hypothetical protein
MIGETTQAAKLDSVGTIQARALAASDDAAPWWPRFGWIDGHRPIDPGTIPSTRVREGSGMVVARARS